MKAEFHLIAPMLHVKSVAETTTYYEKCLGFGVILLMENTDIADYAIVERDGFEVHLLGDPNRNPAEVRSGMNVSVDNVDVLYEEFQSNNAFPENFPRDLDAIREHPPEDKEYGMRDMIFVDPNGYILVFGQPLDEE